MDAALLTQLAAVLTSALPGEDVKHTALPVLQYADTYGYLDGLNTNAPEEEIADDLKIRVGDVQTILQIPADGIPGPQTKRAIDVTGRCGCSDFQFARDQMNRWSLDVCKRGIVWCIVSYLPDIPTADQDELHYLGFKTWTELGREVRHIQTRDKDRANLKIYASADPNEEFGQPGRVLAWCELPRGDSFDMALTMKFDAVENWRWKSGQTQGISLLATIQHEQGHFWGMDHTQKRGQLMFPSIQPGIETPQRGYDIDEYERRYGEAIVTPPPPPPTGDPLKDYDVVHRPTGKKWRMVAA